MSSEAESYVKKLIPAFNILLVRKKTIPIEGSKI
jgi:hypothetical protein